MKHCQYNDHEALHEASPTTDSGLTVIYDVEPIFSGADARMRSEFANADGNTSRVRASFGSVAR